MKKLLATSAILLSLLSTAFAQTIFGGAGGNPCTTTASALQYNSAGSFGCITGWTSNGTTALTGAGTSTIIIGTDLTISSDTIKTATNHFNLGTAVARRIIILSSNSPIWEWNATGHFITSTNNQNDIGTSLGVASPRNIFVSQGISLSPVGASTLSACNAATQGMRRHVTDATTTTFAASPVGGGANSVPVYCNGADWVIGSLESKIYAFLEYLFSFV